MNAKNLRILLAEGGHGEAAESLRALFPEGQNCLELTIVPTVSMLLSAIQGANPEMIFLDLELTRPEPLEAVRRVHFAAPEVPLIIFAEASDKDRAAQCLREGALDYLLKGYMDPPTLDRVLRVALEQNTLGGLTDLLRDPLTGLYIREEFLKLGAHSMETANRKHSTLMLLCVQIANLGAMREEFGNQTAESGLRSAASVLKKCFRPTDVVARTGASQFAVLAVDAAESSGPTLRLRVEQRFAALPHDIFSGGSLALGISTGFWSTRSPKPFFEFLDSVEEGLRAMPLTCEGHSGMRTVAPRR